MELNETQKFEALKLRYSDQVELLREMTRIDLKIFIGYLTLQLAFGGWLSTHIFDNIIIKIGLLLIDLSLAGITSKLLYNNFRRRKEVAQTVRNLNEALNFNRVSYYLPDLKINSTTIFRPWWYWLLIGIIIGFLGVVLIIFSF